MFKIVLTASINVYDVNTVKQITIFSRQIFNCLVFYKNYYNE